jgi:hypothetical protein
MDDKNIIDIEVQYDSKWEKFKHTWWKRKEKAKQWFTEDPRRVLAVGSICVVAAKKVKDIFVAIKPTQAELDRRWQEVHIYDHSLGMHYTLKRPMTGNEQIEFSQRKKRGELTGDILRDMNLLKR